MLDLIFYLVAFGLFLAAAFLHDRVGSRVNLVSLGLALWVFVPLHHAFSHAWPS